MRKLAILGAVCALTALSQTGCVALVAGGAVGTGAACPHSVADMLFFIIENVKVFNTIGVYKYWSLLEVGNLSHLFI